MINWKLIATQLAKEYNSQGLGRWTKQHLVTTWMSFYDFPPSSYTPSSMMGETTGGMYNMFMTITDMPSLKDEEKCDKIFSLLDAIFGGFENTDPLKIIFKKGGYNLNFPDSPEEILIMSRAFHPEVIKHGKKFFERGDFSVCINEVCKAYNKAVQIKSGSDKDGQALMLWAFSETGTLRINSYKTDTESWWICTTI
jgi:hypothetical protein